MKDRLIQIVQEAGGCACRKPWRYSAGMFRETNRDSGRTEACEREARHLSGDAVFMQKKGAPAGELLRRRFVYS